MHIGKGRRNPLHVDYIFLGACLAYIQDAMTEAILSHPRLALDRKIGIVKAIGKVIWIQNDLLAKWHTEDGAEFRDSERLADEVSVATEPEGYLHGKKILGDDSASDKSSNLEETIPGKFGEQVDDGVLLGCPFSGLKIAENMAKPKASAIPVVIKP